MTVGFSGGREHDDPRILAAALKACPWSDQITAVAVGDCPTGFDVLVAAWARERNLRCWVYRADWSKHGKKAGPIRNREIANASEALIAAPGAGRGTYSAIREALRLGLPVFVYEVKR